MTTMMITTMTITTMMRTTTDDRVGGHLDRPGIRERCVNPAATFIVGDADATAEAKSPDR
jgi:hypothetical protein